MGLVMSVIGLRAALCVEHSFKELGPRLWDAVRPPLRDGPCGDFTHPRHLRGAAKCINGFACFCIHA